MGGARAVIVTVRGDALKPALRALRGGSPGRKRPFTPKTAAPCRPNIKHPTPKELFIKRFQKKTCLFGRHVSEVSHI